MGLDRRLQRLEARLSDLAAHDDHGRGDADVRARVLAMWQRLSDEEKDERLERVRRGEIACLRRIAHLV